MREFATGAALGFVISMLFMVADVAGSVAGMAMSLSMAGMVDPNTGDQSTAVANFLTLGAMMAFVALDGHHEAIKGLIYNFRLFPVGTANAAGFDVEGIAQMATALFGTGIRLAAPIVVTTTLINVGLGLMARAAPQVNIFAVGFSILLIAGTLLLDATVVGLEREMAVRVPTLATEMNEGLILLHGPHSGQALPGGAP
ncbi:MAG: flagellar biosynthetic protein FliR [Myxococcota bacterium]